MKFKKIFIILLVLFSICIVGCKEEEKEPDHECVASEWEYDDIYECGDLGLQRKICIICRKVLDEREVVKEHEFEEITNRQASCTSSGLVELKCKNCGKIEREFTPSTGHVYGAFVIDEYASFTKPGKRHIECKNCGITLNSQNYVLNCYPTHGKLSVQGRDLIDKDKRKVQLYGLSTHGIQWFGSYLNFNTISSLQSNFGINVLRIAFYTDENGYCDGTPERKNNMLQNLKNGIDIATKLGLYVIIDWHMVGAENPLDKNPLTYLEQSKEFFYEISKEYSNYDNILYEIMNEPNGPTTWADCKKYAEEVIPEIRKNTDAVVLVGNPSWTADLNSVMKDPLVGFTNIMYTYHFYAASHRSTMQVEKAYDNGFPVFISEYGFMDSDGDGDLNLSSGENWLKVLDARNISYVAWSISNSKGSASIFKTGSYDMVSTEDKNLKPWGIYLKKLYGNKSGINK